MIAFAEVICALLMLAAGTAAGVSLHVSPDGSDGNSGTEARPFATLERARDEVRRLKAAGEAPDTVWIHAGDYLLQAAFELAEEDSGTAARPVIYRSAGGGEVRLMGGVEVTGFEPHEGEMMRADVSALGLHEIPPYEFSRHTGNVPGFELFFQGRRMTLARWPNKIPDDPRWGEWALIPKVTEKTRQWFHYAGDRPAKWSRPAEAQVHFFPWYNYMDQYTGVKSVDPQKRAIHLATPAVYEVQPGRRYYVRNVFEELDAPGEWYLDRTKAVLYFRPPAPLNEGKVVASGTETVVHFNGCSNVTLRGFTIESCRGDAVVVDGGENNLIAGCIVRNTLRDGIAINSGTNHRAVGNDIYAVGRRGILLAGGDRETLTPARNVAENNHIHHVSRLVHTYAPGVQVTGCGNLVSHNLIHDGPHMVMGLSGNDHVIEYNEIHHAMLITSHGGAFYCGRDLTARGNVFRYNKVHDINGYGIDKVDMEQGVFRYASPVRSLPGAFAVHLDDQLSGFHIHGNVFYRIAHGVVRLGGGRDTTIENNIFHDAGWAVHIDNRGMGWQKASLESGTLHKRLVAMDYKRPPWSERYPELVDVLDDHPGEPVDNVIRRNVFSQRNVLYNISRVPADRTSIDQNLVWRGSDQLEVNARTFRPDQGGLLTFEEWRETGFDENSEVGDPGFGDLEADDFRLNDDSPAWDLGFEAIPIDEIGLYDDQLRASDPPPPDQRKMISDQVIEEFPIPDWTPPPKAVHEPTVFTAPRATFPVTVDGDLTADEWQGLNRQSAMVIGQGIKGEASSSQSFAWLAHDGKSLYVGIRTDVAAGAAISATTNWGQDDAVEIAVQSLADAAAPIVLRGYPNGHFESSREAGAPADVARKARESASYAARVRPGEGWDAEWAVSLADLGLPTATDAAFRFNLTVRQAAAGAWVMWQGTGAQSWRVDRAGVLRLGG